MQALLDVAIPDSRRRLRWAPVLLLAFGAFASACGSHHSDETTPETLAVTLDALGAEVDALAALTTAHGEAVEATAELSAIVAEETQHATDEMASHHEIMALLEHMAMCDHHGTPPDTDAMMLRADELDMEIMGHQGAMEAAADVATAATEEARHQAEMLAIVEDLRMHQGMMADMAGDYACPAGHM
jgi:hypothetical protein